MRPPLRLVRFTVFVVDINNQLVVISFFGTFSFFLVFVLKQDKAIKVRTVYVYFCVIPSSYTLKKKRARQRITWGACK